MKGKIKTVNWQLAIYGTYFLKFVQFTLSNDIREAFKNYLADFVG